MKVRVKLYGTLRQRYPDYRETCGIEMDITEGTTVKMLLALLGIDAVKEVAVIFQGRIQKETDTIRPGATVSVLQAVQGG